MGRKIGNGAFGDVFIADAYGVNGNPDKTVVAVKILKGNLLLHSNLVLLPINPFDNNDAMIIVANCIMA